MTEVEDQTHNGNNPEPAGEPLEKSKEYVAQTIIRLGIKLNHRTKHVRSGQVNKQENNPQ